MNVLVEPISYNQTISRWRQWVNQVLDHHLPTRFKRLIFIASTLGVLDWIKHTDKTSLTEINDVLRLAHDPAAIEFPLVKYHWMWQRVPVTVDLADGPPDFHSLARNLIKTAPTYMVYGSTDEVAEDLHVLYRSILEQKNHAPLA
jgi:hypothetical protein